MPSLVAQTPVHMAHFWQTDGYVSTIATDTMNKIFYVGGLFEHVGPPVPYAARVNMADLEPDLNQDAPNDFVNCSVPDGNGGYFIGGGFTAIGQQMARYLGHYEADGSATNWDPGLNGEVFCVALSGDTLFVGGSFSFINGAQRYRIAAFSRTTLQLLAWAPQMNNAVFSILPVGDRLFVGGAFSQVNSIPTGRLALIDRNTGLADPSLPNVNGTVRAVAYRNDTLFVGGEFTQVGGSSRTNLASVHNGVLLPWSPTTNGIVLTMGLSGDSLFVGGQFTYMSGQQRANIGAVRTTTGAVLAWVPNANDWVSAIIAAPDAIYAAGAFTSIGGQSREGLAALDRTNSSSTSWRCDASTAVHTVQIDNGVLFAGGRFRTIACEPRRGLAAIDAMTGRTTGWDAQVSGVVNAVLLNGDTLFVGGNFTTANGVPRSNLAAFRTGTEDLLLPWAPATNFTGSVECLEGVQNMIYLGGNFASVNGVQRQFAAAVDRWLGELTPWDPDPSGRVRVLKHRNGVIYMGGSFFAIAGESRYQLAAVQFDTGSQLPWTPEPGPQFMSGVQDLIPTDDGVYVGGWFQWIGGALRSNLALLDTDIGTALPWGPVPDGSISAFHLEGQRLFISGSFQNLDGGACNSLAIIDLPTGEHMEWDTGIAPIGSGVQELALIDDVLLVSGGFSSVDGLDRYGLAAYHLPFTTASSKPSLDTSLKLFPLPVVDVLYLRGLQPDNTLYAFELYDAVGRTVKTGTFVATSGNATINMTNVPSGVFILNCRSATHSLRTTVTKE